MSAENARGQYLDRNVTPEPRIARAIDLAHAAGAEHSLYFIRAESVTGGQCHGGRIIFARGCAQLSLTL